MKISPKLFSAILLVCFFLSGCVTFSSERRERADAIADENDFEKTFVRTQAFTIAAYFRIREPGKPLQVYVEGDGYAWVTRSRVSDDPTPRQPMVLALAAEDSAPNVIYLARPCQYTQEKVQSAECRDYFWTQGRFSEPVVASMDQALSYFMKKAGASTANLIGYSGGGAIAVLVASRRGDIASLRTIAGNLNPDLVNEHHGVQPLSGSLDPMDAADKVATIPQMHFLGTDDEMIPIAAAESYLKKSGNFQCIQVKMVSRATHADGWKEQWPQLLSIPVVCH